jgi:hypothetical protein
VHPTCAHSRLYASFFLLLEQPGIQDLALFFLWKGLINMTTCLLYGTVLFILKALDIVLKIRFLQPTPLQHLLKYSRLPMRSISMNNNKGLFYLCRELLLAETVGQPQDPILNKDWDLREVFQI